MAIENHDTEIVNDVIVEETPEIITEASPEGQTTDLDNTENNDEVFVDDGKEADTKSGKMTDYQVKAAWKEDRAKKKALAEDKRQLSEQNQKLQDRLDKLETNFSSVLKTQRPDPYDYSSTEEFYQALDEWNSTNNSPQQQAPQNKTQAPSFQLSDEQEYHLFQSENELKGKLPDYDNAKLDVEDNLKMVFGTNEDVVSALSISAHTFGLNPAKIIYALHKINGAAEQLAMVRNDPARTRAKLVELEGKVKFRQKQNVNVIPENDLNQSGQMDSDKKAEHLAFKKWQDNPSLVNHKKLAQIRQKIKSRK